MLLAQIFDVHRSQRHADFEPLHGQIGVSMGGMIALQLASMASFRIASLTLAVTSKSRPPSSMISTFLVHAQA
jgi:homoserine acetyltransferase